MSLLGAEAENILGGLRQLLRALCLQPGVAIKPACLPAFIRHLPTARRPAA